MLLSVLLFSCKNTEIVQKTDRSQMKIEKELRVWNLDRAWELTEELENEEDKIKYKFLIEDKLEKLDKLYKVEEIIKEAFYTGNFSNLDLYMDLNSFNNFKYRKLKELGLSNIRVYFGKREFLDDNVNEIAILNFFEESIYLEINLQYEKNDWLIKSFDEKR